MEQLRELDRVMVRQEKEMGEVLSGFETKNRYRVLDPQGIELCQALEESSFSSRYFLHNSRPFKIHLMAQGGQQVLLLDAPFRFMFRKVDVFNSERQLLGTVEAKFSFLHRLYSVMDTSGRPVFEIKGPAFRPWTFLIKENGREIGKITKKWSGFLKESFTDADNFGLEFPVNLDVPLKSLLLGALFLIDFCHFEGRK